MTFYSQIAANKRQSIFLALAVAAILGVFGFVIGMALTGQVSGGIIATGIAIAIAALSSLGSYFAGDKLVLATSQAREVDEQTAPQLINVAREMSNAAGIPIPKVYVIDDTPPNALATGLDPHHSTLAVTDRLDKNMELQARP